MNETGEDILFGERGVALLLAITVISFLVAVTVEFNKNMRQELVGSSTVLENSQLGAIVKSGYNLAETVLQKDAEDNSHDCRYDRWATLADNKFSRLFSRGTLKLTVTDLAGKLQLNSLGASSKEVAERAREALKNLLESGQFGDLSTDTITLIVDAITDWVDEDDDVKGFEETESSFYQSLNPSYSSKNAPFEYVEELLLVRGVTRDLFFGTQEYKGLRDFVTPHGTDGKININSAPVDILLVINSDLTEELASQMVEFREDEANKDFLSDPDWYLSIASWPQEVKFDTNIATIKSGFFKIAARARYGEIERILDAVVRRESNKTISLISRKVQ